MDEYRVIFNDMGYDFESVNQYYCEIEADFIVGYEPFVGLKHYPSAVDLNTIIIEAEIFEKLFEIAATTIFTEILKRIFYLAKKSYRVKDKYKQDPTIETHITFIDCKLDIYYVNEMIDFNYDVEDIAEKVKEDVSKNRNVSINVLNSHIEINFHKK